MGGDEIRFIEEAFRDNWIAPVGPHINQFEAELAAYTHTKNVVVLSSGTAAIHLALIILGIRPGDHILCSSFTFSGSANPIKYCNATPVFIDSEVDSWNMSPELLEEAILELTAKGKKPKALILVHLYGMPAKMDEILEITSRYNIPLIEDAAEALGSSYKGKMLGSFGDIGILSFNGNKIITTSGGGAFLSGKEEYAAMAKHLSTQARENEVHYEHKFIGYNYRMSNILAGIGRGQLRVLDQFIGRTREINRIYKQELMDTGAKFLEEWSPDCFSNFWLTTMLVRDEQERNRLIARLDEDNIECRPLWKPMHLQPVFKDELSYTHGISEELFSRGICLPSGSGLTDADMGRIVGCIREVIG